MPSAYVWIYRDMAVTKITHGLGCVPHDPSDCRALEALRSGDHLIDAVTGAYRWADAT